MDSEQIRDRELIYETNTLNASGIQRSDPMNLGIQFWLREMAYHLAVISECMIRQETKANSVVSKPWVYKDRFRTGDKVKYVGVMWEVVRVMGQVGYELRNEETGNFVIAPEELLEKI